MSYRLRGVRRRYARKIRRKAGLRSKLLVQAFAEVPREHYLGPGPWKVLTSRKRGVRLRGNNFGYRLTPTAHPRHIYDDILVGIFPERLLNNGLPSALAGWFDHLDLKQGESVVHIGCGTGYYSAILAHVMGPSGHVTAVEIDDELAPRAKANLSHLSQVEVVHGDGSVFDFSAADAIFVNAGATHVPAGWIEMLRPGARLIFPLISMHQLSLPLLFRLDRDETRQRAATFRSNMVGVMLRVTQCDGKYSVTPISTVGIFPCIGAIDRDADATAAKVLARGGYELVRSLRRDQHEADESCWLHGEEVCLSKRW